MGGDGAMTKKVVSISEASKLLGISKEAIRKRIARGSIEASKDSDGHWQVTVYDTSHDTGQDVGDDTRTLLDHLKEENSRLWNELQRKDAIIMNMSENMKLLAPPPPQRVSLLQRIFGRGGE